MKSHSLPICLLACAAISVAVGADSASRITESGATTRRGSRVENAIPRNHIDPHSSRALAAAQVKYDTLCQSCHGADGKGVAAKAVLLKIDSVLLNLTRAEAKALPSEHLRQIIIDGKSKMPAHVKKLTGEEVDGLVAAIRVLQSAG